MRSQLLTNNNLYDKVSLVPFTKKERCNLASQEEQPNRELLKIEYQECVSSGRFIVGIRFSYFVSFTTFFFILVGAFHYVWTSEVEALKQLRPGVMLAIAGFGFYTVIVAMILEKRSIQLYRTSDNRAADVEQLMGIKSGIRQIFMMPFRTQYLFIKKIPITHSMGIAMFYRAVASIWIVLILFSVYEIVYSFFRVKEACCG